MQRHKTLLIILTLILGNLIFLTIPTLQLAKENVEIVGNEQDFVITIVKTDDSDDFPVRILIPSIDTDLIVKASEIVDGTWELSDDSASYAKDSSPIDEQHGNTIMFGHARNGLLLPLLSTKVDDEIFLFGKEAIYEYKVISTEKILPEDIQKIISTGETNLTIFTCEGVGDEYRFVVKAKKINQSKLISEEVI